MQIPTGWTAYVLGSWPTDGELCDVLTPLGERGPFLFKHSDMWIFQAPRGALFEGTVIAWRRHRPGPPEG